MGNRDAFSVVYFAKEGKNLTFFLLALWLQVCFGQENTSLIDPAIASSNFVAERLSEKTYIHTDKDFYFTDETIWFKLYLVDGSTHLKSEKSRLAYVELRDENDNLVLKKKLFIETLSASGDIGLDSSLRPGDYTLSTYTRYIENQNNPLPFEKQITIVGRTSGTGSANYRKPRENRITYKNAASALSDLNVRFFSEGGPMVSGIETSVAVHITDKKGKGIAAKGKIVDENNNLVAFVKSQEFGLGVFKILPLEDKKYFAVLNDNFKYPLPKALTAGYVLNTKNKGDVVLIDITTNIPKGLEGAYILGHLRGRIIHKQQILPDDDSHSYRIRFLNNGLPPGVAQFTLFNADGDPVCQRSIYIPRADTEVTLSVDTFSGPYLPRQKVPIQLSLSDKQGRPISADISVGVTLVDRLSLSNRENSLENWLLLNSDIGGVIDNPEYFFENDSEGRSNLLDALMITREPEPFDWNNALTVETKVDPIIEPEEGIMIKGRTVDFNNRTTAKQAEVKLSLLGLPEGLYEERKVTDTNGEFSFGPYIFPDTLKAVVNAESLEKRRNGKSKNLAIVMEKDTSFTESVAKDRDKTRFILQDEKMPMPKSFATTSGILDFPMDGSVIELDEALVSEKKKTRQDSIDIAFKNLNPLYRNPSKRLFLDSIPGATGLPVFSILLARLPGARIVGPFNNSTLLIRQDSRGNPLFVVDGMVTDVSMVRAMNSAEIEFIDVLTPAAAGAYINRSAFGVVVIYTKGSLNLPSKSKSNERPNVKGLDIVGFATGENFNVPDYSVQMPEHSQPDDRSTLYWQPNIVFGNSGEPDNSEISFYTSDLLGSYMIKVEGITADGTPISSFKVIEVKEQ
jgi:hypothetical protein